LQRILSGGWRALGLALPIVSCAACFGPLVGGDGYLGVTGYVYESPRSALSGDGLVLIDSERSASVQGTGPPIAGCEVTLEPWSPGRRPHGDSANLWTSRDRSDAKGQFTVGGTARPGTYDATLSIACEGFIPVTRVFRHDRQFRHPMGTLE